MCSRVRGVRVILCPDCTPALKTVSLEHVRSALEHRAAERRAGQADSSAAKATDGAAKVHGGQRRAGKRLQTETPQTVKA
jgi:hypothetical protein